MSTIQPPSDIPLIPDAGSREFHPAPAGQSAEERARNFLVRARQRSLSRKSPFLLLTEEQKAAHAAKLAAQAAEDRAEREQIAAANTAAASARAAAGYAPLGTPLDDSTTPVPR
jgi:hypothetical protein